MYSFIIQITEIRIYYTHIYTSTRSPSTLQKKLYTYWTIPLAFWHGVSILTACLWLFPDEITNHSESMSKSDIHPFDCIE